MKPGKMEAFDLTKRLPTPDESMSAAEAAAALARAFDKDRGLTIPVGSGEEVHLEPAVAAMMIDLLGVLARNNMVTIVPTGAELTTQQAANMLNVSRPYLSRLLKQGRIKFVQVGSHRRVPFTALMEFKAERDAGRKQALDDLARLGQEFDA
jgi:excisionase family DNA binding protein